MSFNPGDRISLNHKQFRFPKEKENEYRNGKILKVVNKDIVLVKWEYPKDKKHEWKTDLIKV